MTLIRTLMVTAALLAGGCAKPPSAGDLAFIAPDGSIEENAPIAPFILANGPQAMRLSPDGSQVAYRMEADGVPALHIIGSDGGEARVITPGKAVTFFEWAPDASYILFGADQDGNEQEAYFRYDIASGVTSTVLDATEGGFRQFGDFSGDGSVFAYASTERNGQDFDVYVHDIATGRSRLVREGTYGQYVQAVSPDGSQLVVSEPVGEDSDNLYLLNVATGERTTISEPSPRANHTDAGVEFSDGGNVIHFASNEGMEFATLRRFDRAAGRILQTAVYDVDVDGLSVCGNRVLHTLNRDGFTQIRMGQGNTLTRDVPGVATLQCGGDRYAVLERGYDDPGTIAVVRLESDVPPSVIVSAKRGALDTSDFVKPVSIRMTARDGVELQGLLYVPVQGSFGGKPPVVFDIHGGPTAQSRPGWEPEAQYLISRGIAVFQPNVRGSTGFGRTYTTLDDRKKRLDSVRDLIDMLESPELSAAVDTSRAAVRGGSYGGYMVNAVLAGYQDAFDAGVSLFGVGDWVTALEVASPALKASDLIEYGNIEEPEWREFYTANSPVRVAENIRVPVLYSHGAMDPRIDIAETEIMVRALRENGVEAEFIRIPDEGHGWRKTSNRMFYAVKEAEFLERVLGVE